ncbi:hypothetical protein AAFN47_27475 [Hoeflea sp. CAU 1731]
MSAGERQSLPMDTLSGLDDFKPRPAQRMPAISQEREKRAIDEASQFPSRQAPDDDQLNIKGPKAVLDRFRGLKKTERYKYADLLEMMMDAYEREKGQGA